MKIKALITTLALALGSSSVAMARPVSVEAHAQAQWTFGTRPAPVVRDHRMPVDRDRYYEDTRPTRPGRWNHGYYPQPAPMLLGSGLHFSNDGRSFLTVGLDRGRFTTVRIDGFTGRTMIEQVAIEFEAGQVQVVRGINRVIDGSRPLMLDLDGGARRIVRVVVYGKPVLGHGYGYRGREVGTFSVSLL